MAKIAVRNRNERRVNLVNRLRAKRNKLREDVSNIHLSDKERWEAMQKLQKLPRDSSPARRRNRCKLCGRPRAYNRLTGLCRLHMRTATINGMVPGMRKASW
ncbi:MAG: 30S ribosomal protein S14 [Gammaproteobacteria bacterium]|nr:30S ribosomal protein S14 [Gammaproteobacteria bacterium]MCW5582484.1 30S ribosomal protein S14 [Gammaproteobacteria bacterium]